jgi:hypothetical protein
MTTRSEHMRFCKERALDDLLTDDPTNALASFCSDVQKHPDTADLAQFAAMAGVLHATDAEAMRGFIEGFAE